MHEAFELFILAKRSENVTTGTLGLYDATMQKWESRWPNLSLNDLTPDHLRGFVMWLQGQPFSTQTVHQHFRNMRAIIRWLEAEEMIAHGALRNIKPPKVVEAVPEVLTEMEAADLLIGVRASKRPNAFRDYVIQLFFLITGVRLNELTSLKMDDVNLKGQYAIIREAKGRRQRFVPLGDLLPLEVKRYTMRHRKANQGVGALFVGTEGQPLSRVRVQRIVETDLKQFVDRPLQHTGPHTLRHSACTFLIRKLKDIYKVSVIMGHTNLETTKRYTHLTFDDLKGMERPTLEQLLTARPSKRRAMLSLPEV